MKYKKLNALGFHHVFLPLLVMVGVAIVGTYLIVDSHAQSAKRHRPPVHHVIHHATIHKARIAARRKPVKAKAAATLSGVVDVSSPQCSSLSRIGHYTYGIVGLNGTRLDFAINGCAAAEARHFNAYSLYVGTNYPSRDCSIKMSPYQCGQKAGQFDIRVARGRHLNTSAWWLDVETNSGVPWSTPSNNTAFLHGLYDTLKALPGTNFVGLYSTADMWNQITGGVRFSSAANWYPMGPSSPPSSQKVRSYCSESFAGGHNLFVQYESSQGIDVDIMC